MTDDNYRQRGEQFAQRAQQIDAPELKLVYLGLAAGYDMLARFHDRTDRTAGADPPGGSPSRSGISLEEPREG